LPEAVFGSSDATLTSPENGQAGILIEKATGYPKMDSLSPN
jgi:hypothetical protein